MIKSVSPINITKKITATNKQKYVFAQDLINKSGAFSKEDFFRAVSLKKKYSNISRDEIKKILSEQLVLINNLLKTFFTETHNVLNYLIYDSTQIASREICKKLKSYRLKETILKELLVGENPQNIILYPTSTEIPLIGNINRRNLPFSTSEHLVEHPRDIAAKIVGYQYSEEKLFKYENFRSNKKINIKFLIKEQEAIVNQINATIFNNGIKQDFYYTNEEIKSLRNYIKKYDAINFVLLKKGIDIRNLEKLQYFSRFPKEIKNGTVLPNSDIVIDTVKITDLNFNKKVLAIITYANTNMGHRFKIYRYDKNLIEQNNEIQNLFKKYVLCKQYDKISLLNQKYGKLLQNDEIAEVFMECKKRDDIRENFSDKVLLSDEKLDILWEGGENYIFIRNLKNYDIKRYCNASLPLIKTLKNIIYINNLKNVFINAYAYNNVKHSPAALYLRAGCIPISHTEEEILNMLKSDDKGCDKPVFFMYKTKSKP